MADQSFEQIKLWAQVIGTLATFAALLFGILQYRTAQLWRKKELIAKETKEFFADQQVKSALRLLDWTVFKIELPPNSLGQTEQSAVVNGEILARALRTQSARDSFNPIEVHIRDVFDRFLEGLERFENFVASGLVDAGDIKPYLAYWFEVMSGRRQQMDPTARAALHLYMKTYGYDGTIRLMERCGYTVTDATR